MNDPSKKEECPYIEEFEDFGPVQLFKSAFTNSWNRVLNIIKEQR